VNPSLTATMELRVTNQAGGFIDCDSGLINVGRGSGESFIQELHHTAQGESDVTVLNGTPGVHRVRLQVNGHDFDIPNLQDSETRTIDVSSAMQNGTSNTVLVVAQGPRDSNIVVMVGHSSK
jgi:hypothetical protein